MELSKAFNYMKNIIDNGKLRHNKIVNIKKGLNVYLRTLQIEEAINDYELAILKNVVRYVDDIVNSNMTADEAFVRSLCDAEKVDYATLKSEKGEAVQPEIKKNIEKKLSGNNKAVKTPKSKVKQESYDPSRYKPPVTPPAHLTFDYKPTGSCGRTEEALRKDAIEEWYRDRYGHDDGIWGKCRH